MLALLKSLALAALVGYLISGLLLYLNQHRYLYYPAPERPNHKLETVELAVDGALLKIQRLNPGRSRALLYFGGNAEVVAWNAEDFQQAFSGHTVYLVNYRGYSGSSGSPTEAALFSDALAIYDRFVREHSEISVIGRSLGSGVAVYLASKRSVGQMALVTPFDSLARVAQRLFPIYPASLLLRDRYDSISRVGSVAAPTLVLIAGADEVINPLHAEALAGAFPSEQVQVVRIEGAGHNEISLYPEYLQSLQLFFAKRTEG